MLRQADKTTPASHRNGFSAQLHGSGDHCTVRLSGAIEAEHGDAFASILLGLARRIDRDTTLDLSGLGFISVIGLGVIVSFGNAMRARGCRLTLHGANPQVCRLIRTVRLHELFPPMRSADAPSPHNAARSLATCT